ncbi:MAG: hypothetical protein R8G66_30320 [Cytophagales bacterium]|nr:hypothetical protein [Cytophagales bacterium]
MKQEKFQYTFRVGQTFRQYMQMAVTEEEGKAELTKTLLHREGISEGSEDYTSKYDDLLSELHLVQKR